jgi:hypothetical protein
MVNNWLLAIPLYQHQQEPRLGNSQTSTLELVCILLMLCVDGLTSRSAYVHASQNNKLALDELQLNLCNLPEGITTHF